VIQDRDWIVEQFFNRWNSGASSRVALSPVFFYFCSLAGRDKFGRSATPVTFGDASVVKAIASVSELDDILHGLRDVEGLRFGVGGST